MEEAADGTMLTLSLNCYVLGTPADLSFKVSIDISMDDDDDTPPLVTELHEKIGQILGITRSANISLFKVIDPSINPRSPLLDPGCSGVLKALEKVNAGLSPVEAITLLYCSGSVEWVAPWMFSRPIQDMFAVNSSEEIAYRLDLLVVVPTTNLDVAAALRSHRAQLEAAALQGPHTDNSGAAGPGNLQQAMIAGHGSRKFVFTEAPPPSYEDAMGSYAVPATVSRGPAPSSAASSGWTVGSSFPQAPPQIANHREPPPMAPPTASTAGLLPKQDSIQENSRKKSRRCLIIAVVLGAVVILIILAAWVITKVRNNNNNNNSSSNNNSTTTTSTVTCQKTVIDNFAGVTHINDLGFITTDDKSLTNLTYSNNQVSFIPTTTGYYYEQLAAVTDTSCTANLPGIRYFVFTMNGSGGSLKMRVKTKCTTTTQFDGQMFEVNGSVDQVFTLDLKVLLTSDAYTAHSLSTLTWVGFTPSGGAKTFNVASTKPWLIKNVYAVNDLSACGVINGVAV